MNPALCVFVNEKNSRSGLQAGIQRSRGDFYGRVKGLAAGIAGPEVAYPALAEEFGSLRRQQRIAAAGTAWAAHISTKLKCEGRYAMNSHGNAPLSFVIASFHPRRALWQRSDAIVKLSWWRVSKSESVALHFSSSLP
jgi:hypothetical protein